MEFIKHNVDELLGGYRTPYDPYPSIEQLIEKQLM